ncbi:hypothetical protein L596_027737 [Steinernema carpocapsae]|uniref:MD-2-related lipid-recognition domain-containing protein n=1 Tax=Steinernema carpocapsae TaxID=34508 RepID=A0A4U5LWE6_STECR|nr:hypothetical protein L596_027737 [Steinernema carpocapsae]
MPRGHTLSPGGRRRRSIVESSSPVRSSSIRHHSDSKLEMRSSIALLCCLLPALASATTCDSPTRFPNGTATKFHHFSGGLEGSSLQILNIASAGENAPYPIESSQPINLTMPLSNTGAKIEKLLVDLAVYIWNPSEENSGNCFWEHQDTYGMTDDMDGCDMVNCPVAVGESPDNALVMDISYASAFIESGKLYQLVFTFKNGDRPEEIAYTDFEPPVVGCAVFQTMLNGDE